MQHPVVRMAAINSRCSDLSADPIKVRLKREFQIHENGRAVLSTGVLPEDSEKELRSEFFASFLILY